MNDAEHDFFKPKWRRVAMTVFCGAWSILEWVTGNPFWGVVFTAMTFYCAWRYLYTYEKNTPAE
ncbi:hypothetical protein ACFQ45_01590 [Rhodanobacter aciditrophus]|uniref:DUF3329 domain-containing protein n=1 Tax=Rhodanobacter aciditrophus TaxID=1623218 RepID=A0ABW4AVU7_9GAMM